MKANRTPPHESILAWIAALKSEAESAAAAVAPLRGRIHPRQVPFSSVLDQLELMRQAELEMRWAA